MNSFRVPLCTALLLLLPRPVGAEEQALTLDQALARARERAPVVLSTGARVDEVRARLVGASVRLRENPALEAAAGPRTSDRGDSTDVDLELSQSFELGGRRRARIAGAEAAVDGAVAGGEDVTRRLLRDVAVSFLRALHAGERIHLAEVAGRLSREIVQIAERRFEAGEVSLLDVNVARVSLSRALTEIRSAEATRAAAMGELKLLLGMDGSEPLAVRGDLGDRRRFELEELLVQAAERADLRVFDGEIREAEAEDRMGRALMRPELGLGVRYGREEGADIWQGALRLTLPFFERGQGLRAAALARARRLHLERDAGRRAVHAEVRAAFEIYRLRSEAVEEIERGALPLLDENELLVRRSYEAGQIGLAELLLVRRENQEARVEILERTLEAAVAGVELQASAGVLR